MKRTIDETFFLIVKERIAMATAHISALQKKHEELETRIRSEMKHAARDEAQIRRLKEQKLHLKERIERLREDTLH